MSMKQDALVWVIEREIFEGGGESLAKRARDLGQQVIWWDDLWWATGRWPRLEGQPVCFRGSLFNAQQVAARTAWRPGSWGPLERFNCSAWYDALKDVMLPGPYHILPAYKLFEPEGAALLLALNEAASERRIFIRPDSPLKPFAGKVVDRQTLSWADLERGFYYEDEALPVVVRGFHPLGREWRFVVLGAEVITGCEYQARGRAGLTAEIPAKIWSFVREVARGFSPRAPHPLYVMDICERGGAPYVLELNPFASADLYGCDEVALLSALAKHLT